MEAERSDVGVVCGLCDQFNLVGTAQCTSCANDHTTPSAATWDRVVADGVDHAYQAVARIAGDEGLTLPDARLRVLVRVTS